MCCWQDVTAHCAEWCSSVTNANKHILAELVLRMRWSLSAASVTDWHRHRPCDATTGQNFGCEVSRWLGPWRKFDWRIPEKNSIGFLVLEFTIRTYEQSWLKSPLNFNQPTNFSLPTPAFSSPYHFLPLQFPSLCLSFPSLIHIPLPILFLLLPFPPSLIFPYQVPLPPLFVSSLPTSCHSFFSF